MTHEIGNPFEYGRELGATELVDRATELADLRAAVRNRDKVFLIGPRRFGKTSLLAAVAEEATDEGHAVVRINAEAFETPALFAQSLASAAARALRTPLARANEWAQRMLGRLRPKVTVGTDGLSVEFGVGPGGDGVQTVVDALDAVEALAGARKKGLVVIVDEVQELILPSGLAAEKQIRAAVQGHRHTGYVFAGSATRLLHEMTSDPDRPFYRLGQKIFLGPVPREDFAAFIAETFRRTGYAIEPEAVDRILEHARDVPYNVQRLAHETWEMARARGSAHAVSGEDVDAAVTRIVQKEGPAYATLWRNLTMAQKKALRAVIDFDGRNLQSQEVSRTLDVSRSTIQRALEALEQRQIVRQELDTPESVYLLVDPFVAAWLARAQRI